MNSIILDTPFAPQVVRDVDLVRTLCAQPRRGKVVTVHPIPPLPPSEEWSEEYVERLRAEPRAHYADKALWVERMLGEGGTLLDFGAGIGALQNELEARGYATIGVEVNASAVRTNPHACILFDGERIPLPDNAVDAVVSMNVFEHLEAGHALRMLRECLRVAPQAFISLRRTVNGNTQEVYDEDPTHKLALDQGEWMKLMYEAGEVEAVEIGKPGVGSYLLTRRERPIELPKLFASRRDIPKVLNARGLHGVGVEVGVRTGTYSVMVLLQWAGQKLHLVDSWTWYPSAFPHQPSAAQQEEYYRQACESLAPWVAEGRAEIRRVGSVEGADQFEDGSLDFIYIDAGHSFTECMNDIAAWWPKLKPGGIIAGDDYADEDEWFEVKRAVDTFFADKRGTLHTTPDLTWLFAQES